MEKPNAIKNDSISPNSNEAIITIGQSHSKTHLLLKYTDSAPKRTDQSRLRNALFTFYTQYFSRRKEIRTMPLSARRHYWRKSKPHG